MGLENLNKKYNNNNSSRAYYVWKLTPDGKKDITGHKIVFVGNGAPQTILHRSIQLTIKQHKMPSKLLKITL